MRAVGRREGGVFMNEVSGEGGGERNLARGWTLLRRCVIKRVWGRTKYGCGLRHGSYKFSLIHSIRGGNGVVVYTGSGCTATHCVICSVVCTDLPPGSHERPSYIGFFPPSARSPACPCTAQPTETDQSTTWTTQGDIKVQTLKLNFRVSL